MKLEDLKFKAKIKGIKELVNVVSLNFYEKEIEVRVPYTLEWTLYLIETHSFNDVEELLQYTGLKDKGNEIYE